MYQTSKGHRLRNLKMMYIKLEKASFGSLCLLQHSVYLNEHICNNATSFKYLTSNMYTMQLRLATVEVMFGRVSRLWVPMKRTPFLLPMAKNPNRNHIVSYAMVRKLMRLCQFQLHMMVWILFWVTNPATVSLYLDYLNVRLKIYFHPYMQL